MGRVKGSVRHLSETAGIHGGVILTQTCVEMSCSAAREWRKLLEVSRKNIRSSSIDANRRSKEDVLERSTLATGSMSLSGRVPKRRCENASPREPKLNNSGK